MYESQRYRYNAAECLRVAQEARDPFHRKLHLSMALTWLSLAREDEAAAHDSTGKDGQNSGNSPFRPAA